MQTRSTRRHDGCRIPSKRPTNLHLVGRSACQEPGSQAERYERLRNPAAVVDTGAEGIAAADSGAEMAWAKIIHRWADGSETTMVVGDDRPAFPDVIAELRHEVTLLWRDVVGDEAELEVEEP